MNDSTENPTVEEFDEELERDNFQGQWKAIQGGDDRISLQPNVWKWSDIRAALDKAKDVVDLAEQPQGARRSIGLRNPAFSSGNRTSWTINVGVQMVQPDEIARAHRHNITAFRFVIEGDENAYTNVEGEQFPMTDGDLILTPRGTWHDHANYSDKPVIWLDGLDVGLMKALHAEEFENYHEDVQPNEKGVGYSQTKYGLLQPEGEQDTEFSSPPYRYPWEETKEALLEAERQGIDYDPFNGTRLEFANPKTGTGPTLNTLTLSVQLCPKDEQTRTHRHNSTEIYHVIQGSGRTNVDGEDYEWGVGDCIVIPPRAWHFHEAYDEETILFCVSDKPVFEEFDIEKEETKKSESGMEAEAETPQGTQEKV